MDRKKRPCISIIIPVYQVEKYLKRCLKSVVKQTYKDFEVILVDDGSTDNSGKICDEFQERFGDKIRIKVFHTKNQGPSCARNTGIEHAEGDYFTFIDSDDAFMPDYLEVMEKVMRENAVKVVQCAFTSEEKEFAGHKAVQDANLCIYSNEEAFEKYVTDSEITGYIWGKLYHSSLFDTIRYPENISHGQDSYTTFKFILKAEKIAYVRDKLYYYYRHPDTLTGSFSPKRIKLMGVADEMRSFVKQEGFENIQGILQMIGGYEIAMDFMMLNYFIGHGQDKNYREELAQIRENLFDADWGNPYIKKKYRWMYRLLKISTPLYRVMSAGAQKLLGCTYW